MKLGVNLLVRHLTEVVAWLGTLGRAGRRLDCVRFKRETLRSRT
jgi:hypothetical protein